MASDSRHRLALRRIDAHTRAKVCRRINRNTLGWYRLPGGESFSFNGRDLENNPPLRKAFTQAVLLAEHSARNVTWN